MQNEEFPDRGFIERKANRYKLADAFVNDGLVGPSRRFDLMVGGGEWDIRAALELTAARWCDTSTGGPEQLQPALQPG